MNQNEKIKQVFTSRLKHLENLKKQVQASLKRAPEGSLILSKSHGITQFFHKTEKGQKKGTYIPKCDERFIASLAQKDYDNLFYKEILQQEKQLNKILENLPEKKLGDVYANLTEERKEYVVPYVLSDEEYVKQWLNVKYEGKKNHSDSLKYRTKRGEFVRSKSEKIIADKLFDLGIPYRYEYPLDTKRWGTIYPDFLILIVSSRKEVIFEYFGMMDNPEYCEKALARIQELEQEGYVLGKTLLVAFESPKVPLKIDQIEKMLKELM